MRDEIAKTYCSSRNKSPPYPFKNSGKCFGLDETYERTEKDHDEKDGDEQPYDKREAEIKMFKGFKNHNVTQSRISADFIIVLAHAEETYAGEIQLKLTPVE